jgi:hypothetical protein
LNDCELNSIKSKVKAYAFSWLEFGIDYFENEVFLDIEVFEVQKHIKLEASVVSFCKVGEQEVRKIITGNNLMRNLNIGRYRLCFIAGALVTIAELKKTI